MSDILRIKEKADIVDIISSYIELSSAGKSFKGKCPFHNEKSPSFFVSPERQNYYCFGCGAKGDVISFVEQYESLDFVGALKLLAERVGVELTGASSSSRNRDDISRLYSTMEIATETFETWLTKHPDVKAYALQRGLSEKALEHWRIGYAKDEWRGLHDVLADKDYTLDEMKEAGLIRDVEGKRVIDLFRNRLMFPIRDITGRVIAFSGRTLSSEKNVPKYVNSPETHVFKKSSVLFGLFEAKQAIRHAGYVILVEGQMDVIMLHEKGLKNTVASSGTAFTVEQAHILKRISPKLVLLYDGDSAGKDASLRAAEIALQAGIETKIARLPQGSDPADVAKDDSEALKEVLKKANHAIFVAAKMVMDDEKRPERRVSLITQTVLPLVLKIESTSLREHFIRELGRMIGVSEESLMHDFKKLEQKGVEKFTEETGRASPDKEVAPQNEEERIVKVLRQLLGIVAWLSPNKEKSELVSYIQNNIDTIYTPLGDEEKNNFIEMAQDTGSAFEAERIYGSLSDKDLKQVIEDVLKQLKLEVLRVQYAILSDPQQKFQIRKEIDILQASH